MTLLFLESVGTTELLVVLLVALVVFGPRRLPELARTLGGKLTELKRATNDFKSTWEREVIIESIDREVAIERLRIAEALPTPAVLTEEHAAPAENPPGHDRHPGAGRDRRARLARRNLRARHH